jgi:hypothetical protein
MGVEGGRGSHHIANENGRKLRRKVSRAASLQDRKGQKARNVSLH